MFSIPDATEPRAKLADWLELKAISSPDGRVGFSTLVSASALAEEQQAQDIADEDIRDDNLVLSAQEEIERRRSTIRDDYPFRIDDTGRALEFVMPESNAGYVYLFCLFLSHACDRTIVPKSLAPNVTNEIRNLFQACATGAAGGYVEGPAVSFGFPRPDETGFLDALHRVYNLFGDGKPVGKPGPAATSRVKDNGIDIIAWRRPVDRLPTTMYLVGQVASGRNWEQKSVKADREHFHKYWFEKEPASQPTDAIFIPFSLEPEEPNDGTPYEDVLNDYMRYIGYRFGTVFYRDRIAHYVSKGLKLAAEGEKDIERVQDVEKVSEWVNNYTQRLRTARDRTESQAA